MQHKKYDKLRSILYRVDRHENFKMIIIHSIARTHPSKVIWTGKKRKGAMETKKKGVAHSFNLTFLFNEIACPEPKTGANRRRLVGDLVCWCLINEATNLKAKVLVTRSCIGIIHMCSCIHSQLLIKCFHGYC